MKIFRAHFVALGLAAAALSSCGRSNYSFQSKAPAYLGSLPVASRPGAPPCAAPVPPPATAPGKPAAAVSAVAVITPAAAPLPARVAAPASLPAAAGPTVALEAVATAAPIKAAKLPLGPRLALHRVLRQAATAVARQQNTANATHASAKTASKSVFVIAVIGLISLIIGIIASSGFLITLGIVLLIIGAALYFLKLL